MIEKMKLPAIVKEGFEADDVIGSLCVQWEEDFDEILIASGDKDLMQFVNEKVRMLDTMKDKIYDENGVWEKMGVRPKQIVDYLTLVGDSSDNIPGVKGIGAKGAAKLLEDFDTLDNAIEKIEEISQKRVKTSLEKEDGMVDLSRKLVQIVTDIDLGKSSSEVEYHFHASSELYDFFEKYGFNTAIKQIKNMEEAEFHAGNVAGGPVAKKQIELTLIESDEDLENLSQSLEKSKRMIFDYDFSEARPENVTVAKFSICLDGTYFDIKNNLNLKAFRESFQRNDLMVIGHELNHLHYLIK